MGWVRGRISAPSTLGPHGGSSGTNIKAPITSLLDITQIARQTTKRGEETIRKFAWRVLIQPQSTSVSHRSGLGRDLWDRRRKTRFRRARLRRRYRHRFDESQFWLFRQQTKRGRGGENGDQAWARTNPTIGTSATIRLYQPDDDQCLNKTPCGPWPGSDENGEKMARIIPDYSYWPGAALRDRQG